ncbi:MAG: tripartite tricarboxylate transporter TctB family protein [Desulfobacterales bacterium]|nr:tripartite tricarboxylate transporter TctB family protein [Desulfobacterales bacterium]
MNTRQRVNLTCGVVCFLFAAIYMYFTIMIDPGAQIQLVSTKFVPKLLAALIAILSLLLMIVTVTTGSIQKEFEEPEQADRQAFYGTVMVSFLSLAVWSMIGFLSVPFLIGGTMVVNHSRETVKILTVSLGTTLILYLVFFQLFELPVPLGLLEAFLE